LLKQRIQFLIETKGLQKTAQDLKGFKLGLRDTFAGLKKGTTTRNLNRINDSLKEMKVNMGAVNLTTRKFRAEFLGLMFGGMAMQRVFLGAFKSLIETMKTSVLLEPIYPTRPFCISGCRLVCSSRKALFRLIFCPKPTNGIRKKLNISKKRNLV